jgi:DNA (cytosine-5)-methyltransferase 1
MNAIHPNDRIYALEVAVRLAHDNHADLKVLLDLREMPAEANCRRHPLGLVLATSSGGAARDLDQPLPTIIIGGAGSERPGCARPQLVEPIIVPMSDISSADVPRSVADPIRTVTTAKGGDQAMAVPVPSVTAKARFGLAEPVLMRAGQGDSDGRDPASRVLDAGGPMPALTSSNEMALAEPIVMRGNVRTGRTGGIRTASEPMPTITCSESLA